MSTGGLVSILFLIFGVEFERDFENLKRNLGNPGEIFAIIMNFFRNSVLDKLKCHVVLREAY